MSTLQAFAVRSSVALVALVAMLLSYHALALRAAEASIPGALAWLYPLAVDGLLVVGMIAAYVLRSSTPGKRAYAWSVTGVGLLISEIGNALAGELRWDLIALRALPPIALALSLHLLVILAKVERPVRAPRRAPASAPASNGHAPELAALVAEAPADERSESDKARALIAERRAAGEHIGAAELCERFVLKSSSARRLLSERPRSPETR